MHTAHRKRTYRKYKRHWMIDHREGSWYARSLCGKLLYTGLFADTIPEITCKTCRRRFAYWQKEKPV